VRPERCQARDHRIYKTSFLDLTSHPEVAVSLLLAVIKKIRFADAGREHRCGIAEFGAEVVVALRRKPGKDARLTSAPAGKYRSC
jgi:hypothetical protein